MSKLPIIRRANMKVYALEGKIIEKRAVWVMIYRELTIDHVN